jgi:hypothetical protein
MISFEDSHSTGGEDSIWSGYNAPLDVNDERGRRSLETAQFKPGDMAQTAPYLNVIDIFPSNAFTISPGSVGWFTLFPIAANETVYIAGSISKLDPAFRGDDIQGKYKGRPTARVLDEDGEILGGIQHALTYGKKVEPVGCLSWQEQNLTTFYKQLARK